MFVSDLKLGQYYELKALELFDYKTYEHSKCKNKYYDLKLIMKNDTIILVEVKCDRLAIRTQNIAIEYMCNNKDSGIKTTNANYYIYYIIGTNIVYKIPTLELLNICTDCKIVYGVDRKQSKMYLVPMNILDIYRVKQNDKI